MSSKHYDGLALAAIGAAAAASIALYDELPDRVATHFDIHGQANGWMSRPLAAAFVPAMAFATWALLRGLPRVLPIADRERLRGGALPLVAALTAVFMAAVHVVVLRVAIGPGVSPTKAVLVLTGVLFVAIGLVLPRVRRNPVLGIRTAWTLRSDENWARTQRVGGYAMVIAGISTAMGGIVGGALGSVVALASLLLAAVVPIVYSLILARRSERGS